MQAERELVRHQKKRIQEKPVNIANTYFYCFIIQLRLLRCAKIDAQCYTTSLIFYIIYRSANVLKKAIGTLILINIRILIGMRFFKRESLIETLFISIIDSY